MELLKELYGISARTHQEKDMTVFVSQRLTDLGVTFTVDETGNIYATKGNADTYPCIAAHLDEVHEAREKGYEVLIVKDEFIIGFNSEKREFNGIGADDKNGIWVCLKCLEKFDNLKCVFFVGEEQGCIGSRQADMKFFDDCRFVLQCDRKGNSDFISNIYGNPLCSSQFIKDASLGEHGYMEERGMQTDVQTLRQRGLEISCANISCGYYYPHTPHEMTNIADLKKCLTLVEHIVENCREVYTHKEVRPQRWDYRSDFFSDAFLPRSEKRYTELNTRKQNKPSKAIKEAAEACTRNQRAEAKDRMRSFFSLNPDGRLSVFEVIYADFFPRLKKEDFDNIYKAVMKEMASGRKKRSTHPLYGSLRKITSKQKSKATI
jgi:tripeptide aminopeptidase|nr:MAG TPA: cellulase [Caudoviricetes sp.]